MRLPGTIYLGHRKIKVKQIGARTANKDEIYGDFDVSKDLIRIDKTLEPTRKLNTFIHEIVHVLLDHFNAELKLKDEEKVCFFCKEFWHSKLNSSHCLLSFSQKYY